VPEAYFDTSRAELAFQFAESMVLTKCTKSGGPERLQVLPHARKLLGNLYGWRRDDGNRLIRKVYFSFARKNAKTQYAAVIALIELILTKEHAPEIYMAAVDRDQASLCFEAAAEMVRATPGLDSLVEVIPSRKTIRNPDNGGIIRALSSEGRSKHGLNPSCVIFDELHAWDTYDQELYDALTTGSAARRNPLMIVITTAGSEMESICRREYEYARRVLSGNVEDPTYLPLIYEVPETADWSDEANWHLANPAIDTIIDRQFLREERDKALARPADQNRFRRLYCNQWTSAESAWIPVGEWDACGSPELPPELKDLPCWCGLDLGATRDLTALSMVWPRDGSYAAKVHFFLPGDDLAARSRRDGVNYDVWARQGWLTLTPGVVTDWQFVAGHIQNMAAEWRIEGIAFDRYGARDVAQTLKQAGLNVVEFGQGYISMSPPAKRLEELVFSRKIQHDGSPVLRWNVECCSITTDPAGNIKPVHPERHRDSRRIDGVTALVMGIGVAMAHEQEGSSPRLWVV
jgi:phage terminase large subunit-like protein